MADPKGFMKYPREGPKRRPVELRVLDWKEFYEPMAEDALKAQGARCMDCGVPFCQSHNGCPVVNQSGDEVGRLVDLVARVHTDDYPAVTGMVVRVGRRHAYLDASATEGVVPAHVLHTRCLRLAASDATKPGPR